MREPVDVLFPRYGRAAYRAMKVVVGGAMKALYDVDVLGLGNIPATGPAILAANHVSFLDSFFVPLVVPRRVTYLAKAEYWDSWKTRWFFTSVGQIPVRRQDSEKAKAALEAGAGVLGAGGLLGIYPEGTRSPDGRLHKGKTGVARLAVCAGCPIVPVGLVGTREIMPVERKLPNPCGKVRVMFGEPLTVTPAAAQDPMALRNAVDALMYSIMTMTGQQYVDRYADRKARAPAADAAAVPSVAG